MSFVNRYSYVLGSLVLVAAGIYFALYPNAYQIQFGTGSLVVTTLLLVFWVAVRRGPLTPANPAKRVRRALAAGRPVIIHFYSDFNLLSLLLRLFSAAGERQARGRCELIYISAAHQDAAAVAREIGASLGDYLLYDGTGKLASKPRRLTPEAVDSLLARVAQ